MTKKELLEFVQSEPLRDFIRLELKAAEVKDVRDRVDALVRLFQIYLREAKKYHLKISYQRFVEYRALEEVLSAEELTALGIPPLTDEEKERIQNVMDYLAREKQQQ